MSSNTCENVWRELKTKGLESVDTRAATQSAVDAKRSDGLRALVRRSLVNSVLGRPYSDVSMDYQLGLLEGTQLPQLYLGRWVQPIIDYIGSRVVAAATAAVVYRRLPGLGMPSDIDFFLEPATTGKLFKS